MKHQILLVIISVLFLSVSCKTSTPDPLTKVRLAYEIKTPKSPTKNSPLLILLHGYGSNEKDLFGFADQLDDRLTVVCPRAPITLQTNRYAWYNLNLNSGETKYQFENVAKAKNEIVSFIKEIQQKHGLNNSKVIVGGFSQGAIMSSYIGLTEPEMIDGIIALSGHLYPEVRNQIKFNPALNDVAIFVSHGQQDNVLSFDQAKNGVDYLENRGLQVDEHYYQAKHQITSENFQSMKQWISNQIN